MPWWGSPPRTSPVASSAARRTSWFHGQPARAPECRSRSGYVEAKDCDVDLGAIERDSNLRNPRTDNGRQLKRYRAALSNLLLTTTLSSAGTWTENRARLSGWRTWTTATA